MGLFLYPNIYEVSDMAKIKSHELCKNCKLMGCAYNPLSEKEAEEKRQATKESPKLTAWIHSHWMGCYCPRHKSYKIYGKRGWHFNEAYLNEDLTPKYLMLIRDIRKYTRDIENYERFSGSDWVLDKDLMSEGHTIDPKTLTVCTTYENREYHV